MKGLKKIVILLAIVAAKEASAQDPSFSQFFSSPLNVNPALTGQINSKWRLISNIRRQWSGPSNPYTTGTISFDNKIFQNLADNYVDEITRVAVGGMMMYDEAMGGALKSSYASFNISGNVRLATGSARYEENGTRIRHLSKVSGDGEAEHRLGAGIGISYGNRRLDLSKLNFEEQFTGFGFNTSLPTGENALSNMKGWFSANAGLLYSYIGTNTNFDLGASVYHINRPKQTFLDDPKQSLAPRYVVHSNLETILVDNVVLNTNGIYQYQSGASYFSIGGALGYYLPTNDEDKDMIVRGGLWYWSKNAISPYIGFTYGNFEIGVTYDITTSKLTQNALRMHTYELCFILRGDGRSGGGSIPSPWR
jgi:type IX secretion system PorP/SprF family membrane protein